MIRHLYAVFGLLLVLAPRNPIAAAEMFAPPPNRITPVRSPDGVTFEAYEWGNPDGKSIVFIHGIYQSALSWAKQVGDPALAHKYRLVAIDLRGHGASEKPDGAEFYREGKRWADDITALMDTLHLNRPVMVLGESFGLRDDVLLGADIQRLLHFWISNSARTLIMQFPAQASPPVR